VGWSCFFFFAFDPSKIRCGVEKGGARLPATAAKATAQPSRPGRNSNLGRTLTAPAPPNTPWPRAPGPYTGTILSVRPSRGIARASGFVSPSTSAQYTGHLPLSASPPRHFKSSRLQIPLTPASHSPSKRP
jgi:hypothetical protein